MKPESRRHILAFAVTAAIAVMLYFLLGALAALHGTGGWSRFFSWRLPLALCLPTMLLRGWNLLGLRRNLRRALRRDAWSYFVLVPFLPALEMTGAPQSRAIYLGAWYLALLLFKGWILFDFLKRNIRTMPAHFSTALFTGLFWFFGAYAAWEAPIHPLSGDEPHYLLMAHSLVHDADLNLFDEYQTGVYREFYKGKLEPKPSDIVLPGVIKSRGLGASFSLLLAPAYFIGGYWGVVCLMALLTALLIYHLFYLVLENLDDAESALTAAAITGVCSPVLTYSALVYPDTVAALLIVYAFRLLSRGDAIRTRTLLANIVIICAGLLFLKFRYFPIILLLVAGGYFRLPRYKRKIFVFLSVIFAMAAIYIFVDLFIMEGDLFAGRFGGYQKLKNYLPGLRSFLVVPGFLLDQEAGLFWIAPVYFLAILGARRWTRTKTLAYRLSLAAVPLVMASLLGHFAWHNCPTPPLRYLLPVLPLLAIPGAWVACRWNALPASLRISAILLTGLSLTFSFITSINPDFLVNYADGSARLFESLNTSLHRPVTSLLPSFIRPGIVDIPWSLAFIAMVFLFLSRNKQGKESAFFPASPGAVFLLAGGILFISRTAAFLPSGTIEAEDIFQSAPGGGKSFPFPKDPFFHHEHHYGWQISENDALHPTVRVRPGDYTCVIGARLVDPLRAASVFIAHAGGAPLGFKVYGNRWTYFMTPFTVNSGSMPLTIHTDTTKRRTIAIDNIRFIRKSKALWHAWKTAANIARRLELTRIEFFCWKQALYRCPGNPGADFQRYFHPMKNSSTVKPSARSPITRDEIAEIYACARELSLDAVHDLESLLGFSAFKTFPEDHLREYLTREFLLGVSGNLAPELRKLCDDHPDNSVWKLFLFMMEYQNSRFKPMIDIFLEMKKQGWTSARLGKPTTFLAYVPEFSDLFHAMEADVEFSRYFEQRVRRFCYRAQKAFQQGEYRKAAELLSAYYNLDSEMFLDAAPEQFNGRFVERIFPLMSFRASDAIRLSDGFFQRGRHREALIAAEAASESGGGSVECHFTLARALFHNRKFDEAIGQCLYALTLDFNNDTVRNLLEMTRDAMRKRAEWLSRTERKP